MTENLYHYTSYKSCIEIIKHNTLLFNRLKNMNDINELYRPLFFDDFNMTCSEMNKAANRFINQFQQMSLTIDGKRKGFDIPAMWGHYANKGKGVCIVFDKELFISSLKGNEKIIQHGEFSYTNSFSSEIHYKNEKEILNLTSSRIKEIFFRKTKDWAYEQEYRVVAYAPEEQNRIVHNLSNSVRAVIMFDSPNFQKAKALFCNKLHSINENIKLLNYSSFINERMIVDENSNTLWSTNNWKSITIDVKS